MIKGGGKTNQGWTGTGRTPKHFFAFIDTSRILYKTEPKQGGRVGHCIIMTKVTLVNDVIYSSQYRSSGATTFL